MTFSILRVPPHPEDPYRDDTIVTVRDGDRIVSRIMFYSIDLAAAWLAKNHPKATMTKEPDLTLAGMIARHLDTST